MNCLRLPVPAWVLAFSLILPVIGAAQPPAADEPVRFDVWEFEVAGNTRLDNRQIERTVYPFLGPARTVADMEEARRALETLYRDAGYGTVIVNIPEQDVDEGIVRLDVIEGTVDRLIVSGASYFSPKRIRQAAPSLAPGRVPELPAVQRELLALNAVTPDRRITPVLRPGRDPGTLEAELKVDDRLPFHGNVEVSNRYTRDTTRSRLAATLRYDNLWQREHSAGIGYVVAPEDPDEVSVLFGTYSARLADTGWLASGYLVRSDTSVATVGTLGVLGKGNIAGLRFIRPLPPVGGGFQRLTLGLDLKDFDESIALTGNQPTIETPVDYGTLMAGWGLVFIGEGRVSDLSLEGVFGPRFLGNDAEEFANKRIGASPSFAALKLGFSHERELPATTRLRWAVGGQLADGPLISNEQFSFGGETSLRGYLESQQFVDRGYSTQLEFLSPDWGQRLPGVSAGRLLAFVDAGGGSLRDPQPEQKSSFFLWSAGLGLRAAGWRGLSTNLYWAYSFEDTVDESVLSGDDRWHFNIRWDF